MLGLGGGFWEEEGEYRPWRDMRSACQLPDGRGRADGRTRLRWSWIGAGG